MGMHAAYRSIDFADVDVDADHAIADLREAGSGDEADVARTKNGNAHGLSGAANSAPRPIRDCLA